MTKRPHPSRCVQAVHLRTTQPNKTKKPCISSPVERNTQIDSEGGMEVPNEQVLQHNMATKERIWTQADIIQGYCAIKSSQDEHEFPVSQRCVKGTRGWNMELTGHHLRPPTVLWERKKIPRVKHNIIADRLVSPPPGFVVSTRSPPNTKVSLKRDTPSPPPKMYISLPMAHAL